MTRRAARPPAAPTTIAAIATIAATTTTDIAFAMDELRALIAIAEGPAGAEAGFARRHVAALRGMLADLEAARGAEKGLEAYRALLLAAPGDALLAPKHVKARWAAVRDLPIAELREGLLGLAAELKRDDVLGEAWKAALNDYTALANLGTGAYNPTDGPEQRRFCLDAMLGLAPGSSGPMGPRCTTVIARAEALVRKLLGLLEIAEREDLAPSPEAAENLSADLQHLIAVRENHQACLGSRAPPRRAAAAAARRA